MLTSPLELNYQQTPVAGEETSFRSSPKKELGRDDFLTLLVAQLRHQNPLSPMESADFTAQLAQFSSLEQLFGMNDTLADIQSSLATREDKNILDYIGKSVKINDTTIAVKNGGTDTGAYTLENRADVTIFIYNNEGQEIRRIDAGWENAGEHELNWDGRNNNGLEVSDGIYTFEIEAMDENGYAAYSKASFTGTVNGVSYENDIPYLMVGNRLVTPEEIIEVKESSNS